MTHRLASDLGSGRRATFVVIGIAAVVFAMVAVAFVVGAATPLYAQPPSGQSTMQPSPTQVPAPQWQTAAGGKMEFSVASVKPDSAAMSQDTVYSNFPLGPGDYYTPNGGLFRATDFPLLAYIAFAYKLTSNDAKTFFDQLPKWVTSDRYDIEARADGNPTKDQMRLMGSSIRPALRSSASRRRFAGTIGICSVVLAPERRRAEPATLYRSRIAAQRRADCD
jgi:hypothetical protein